MTLADVSLRELDNPALSSAERAGARCRAAAELIQVGRHTDAREALGELWRGIGERPALEGLDGVTAAEVLLQAGALSGWLGASGQVQGAQAAAKDLLSESASLFERHGRAARAALARSDLALCYWREGAYDEARVLYVRALEEVADAEEKAKVLLRLLTVEYSAKRYEDALALLTENSRLFGEGLSHVLRGSFHNHLALVLRRLGSVAGRAEYLDRAIIEYTAAIFHYEQAGHERYLATNENNLAFLLYKLGRYADAHEHLGRARSILTRLKDPGMLAQVDETRARVLAAEGKYVEAERTLAGAVRALEQGDESAPLADALTLRGVIRARLGDREGSIEALRRAAGLAESAGALTNAGQALLTLVEEHGASSRLRPDEVHDAYLRADELLSETQDAEDIARLRACAQSVMTRLTTAPLGEKEFSLYGVVQEYEARLIEQALEESGGSLVGAARLLGLTHQTLGSILNSRHSRLFGKRKPVRKRMKSIIKETKR